MALSTKMALSTMCLEKTVLELRRHENVSLLYLLGGALFKWQTHFGADARRTADWKVFGVDASVLADRGLHDGGI